MEQARSVAQLAAQMRVVFCDLKAEHEIGGRFSPQQRVHFSRRYAAEMYYCVEELRNEADAAKAAGFDDEEEFRAEIQRTLWSVCIWELCALMFLRRPLVVGEALLRWWQATLVTVILFLRFSCRRIKWLQICALSRTNWCTSFSPPPHPPPITPTTTIQPPHATSVDAPP